jgi:hypothetical protein
MARKTAELLGPEAEEAEFVEVKSSPAIFPIELDPDSESSWDDWIESLKGSDHPGVVRAYRIPLDADGNPSVAKGSRQILLGTWPHQQFSYDDLIAKIKVEFLKPGEMAAVRFAGTQPGRRGVVFNKIVTLQRAAESGSSPVASGGLDTVGLLRAFQEATAAQQAMTERLLASREAAPAKPMSESVKEWLAILAPILGPAVLAIVNRPKEKSDLEGLMGVVLKLKGMADDSKGGTDDESTTMSIIKAVAPEGLKLLTALAQNQQPRAALPSPTRRIPPRRVAAPIEQVPTPTEPAPVQPPPEATTEADPMLAQLKPQLDTLAEMAAQGADPAEVAKLVLETLPATDEVDEQVLKLVSSPEAFGRLYILSPKFGEQREWGEKLRLAILAEFPEEEAPPAATG